MMIKRKICLNGIKCKFFYLDIFYTTTVEPNENEKFVVRFY
jgi:hypothetical protein